MKAGSKLDLLVAEKVMSAKLVDLGPNYSIALVNPAGGTHHPHLFQMKTCDGKMWDPEYEDPPPYSTKISVAWEIVEKMIKDGFDDFSLDYSDDWLCFFSDYSEAGGKFGSDTAPLAICLAALKTLGIA